VCSCIATSRRSAPPGFETTHEIEMREMGVGTLSVQLNFSGFLLRNTSDASVSVPYIVVIGAPVDIAWAALACVLLEN
jgi:hypothetical protein